MTNTYTIYTYLLGPMNNLSYVVVCNATQQAALVDPGWEGAFLCDKIVSIDCKLSAVWLTHGHFDHVDALPTILETYTVPVYLSAQEVPSLTPNTPLIRTNHNQVLTLGNLTVTCLHTPGHTPGGQCFWFEDALITGDTLFVDGCGKCSYSHSNTEAMYTSLFETLAQLPGETVIYPGHEYGHAQTDTLAHQRLTNRFLLSKTKAEFIRKRELT